MPLSRNEGGTCLRTQSIAHYSSATTRSQHLACHVPSASSTNEGSVIQGTMGLHTLSTVSTNKRLCGVEKAVNINNERLGSDKPKQHQQKTEKPIFCERKTMKPAGEQKRIEYGRV